MSGDDLLDFPCDFPVKVMGRADEAFERVATEIVERHAGPLGPERRARRASRDGNFVSLTLTIRAESREQLDALYSELSAHQRVLMVL